MSSQASRNAYGPRFPHHHGILRLIILLHVVAYWLSRIFLRYVTYSSTYLHEDLMFIVYQ